MTERFSRELPVKQRDLSSQIRDYAFYFLRLKKEFGGAADGERAANYQAKLGQLQQELGSTLSASIESWVLALARGGAAPLPTAAEVIDLGELIVPPGAGSGPRRGDYESNGDQKIGRRNAWAAETLAKFGILYAVVSHRADLLTEAGAFRSEPYFAYLLKKLRKVLLVCDQPRNLTFVIHGVDCDNQAEWLAAVRRSKEELHERGNVDAVPNFDDQRVWEKMLAAILRSPQDSAVQWKGSSTVAHGLKVSIATLKDAVAAVCAANPMLKEFVVSHTAGSRGVGGGEVTRIFYAKQLVARVAEYLSEQNKIPEGWVDSHQAAALIFAKLGGEPIFGAPFEALRQELYYIVYNSFKRNKERNSAGAQAGDLPGLNRERVLVDLATVDQIIERKRKDLVFPLLPESFEKRGVAEMAKELMAEHSLPPVQYKALQLAIHDSLKSEAEIRGLIRPYQNASQPGNYGKFRPAPLGRPSHFFSFELYHSVKDLFKRRIERNRALPPLANGDKTVGMIVEQFLAEHENIPFNSQELYFFLFRTLGLRATTESGAKNVESSGEPVKQAVFCLFDSQPVAVFPRERVGELLRLLETKCAAEAACPVVQDGDVSRDILVGNITRRLREVGVKRNKEILAQKLAPALAYLETIGYDVSRSGLKRIAVDKFKKVIFFAPAAAKLLEDKVVADCLQSERQRKEP